jgi:hypothetical protein
MSDRYGLACEATLQILKFSGMKYLFLAISIMAMVSCKKDKDKNSTSISDASNGANEKTINYDFAGPLTAKTLITLKNEFSGSGVNSINVKLAIDSAAITAAKTKILPAGSYTLPLSYDVPPNGTVDVQISLNPGLIPVDTTYSIALKIQSVSSGNITTAQTFLIKFDGRNRWDGRYRLTGTMVDIAAPTLTAYSPQDMDVITVTSNSVMFVPRDLGIPGILILSGTSLSYYGSFGPVLIFNPIDNKITTVYNYYGQPASNTRSAQIDPSGVNSFNPTSKTIQVKYFQLQPNTVTTPPYRRVFFESTLTYLGPRYK